MRRIAISAWVVMAACGGEISEFGGPAAATIRSFDASPTMLTEGESARLSWIASGALSLDQGIGNVSGQSVTVTPAATTTYTLTASTAGGSTTSSLTVTVAKAAGAPRINAFSAAAPTISRGGSTSLTWNVSGATSLSLDQGIGAVTGESKSVSPTETTVYTLTAHNAAGSASATTTLQVSSSSNQPLRMTLFSKTQAFRHSSIPAAVAAIQNLGRDAGWQVEATEDSAALVAAIPQRDLLVFVMTTGDVLTDAQQPAVEAFIRAGGGIVGIHSAADTEYGWPFYGELLGGAWFQGHPAIQQATVRVEAPAHPTAAGLPATWVRTDEWYNFQKNPRSKVQVVLTLDESSYQGGSMGADHPISWCHPVDQGRFFYTGLGHTEESWKEPEFLGHVRAGILWAAQR
jgi:type 1 glutamine amidotransferase